jgi:hypothetical protein
LIELQKTDSQINKINVRHRSLPEELVKLEEEYQSFQAGVEEEGQRFAEIQKSHREKEEKLKKGQEALKRARERLGEVKTNKEYQAVLKEIEAIGGKNSETEDEIIALLDVVDNLKDKLAIKEEEMGVRKRRYEGERKKLEEELKSLDISHSACQQRYEELKGKIADDFLKRYEAIKTLNHGLAVVAVWKEICEGCYTSLPPQLYIELQKSSELHMCPNCSRIIYWYDRNGEELK